MEAGDSKNGGRDAGQSLGWFDTVHSWYSRFERPISSLSLVGGFVFDALTLKRVDLFWENFWVVVHLLVVMIAIILLNREELGGSIDGVDKKNPAKFHFWLRNVLQFAFGGLLSTYLVFYFRSGVLSVSWPFFLILAIAFIANESLKKHFSRISFQIAFLFLSLYSFAIFFLPVVLHALSPFVFVLSGVASLLGIIIFLILLRIFSGEHFKKSRGYVWASIIGIIIAMNLLYFFNLIPPIPLSLKDAGIYHSISRNSDGNYVVEGEDQPGITSWSHYFNLSSIFALFNIDETVHISGDLYGTLYFYSAVFSPAAFSTSIIHEWQYYDTETKKWVTTDKITLDVNGGRDGGYRTYSLKNGIDPGLWRVNVETPRGQIIGRVEFQVDASTTTPALVGEIKG